MDTGSVWMVCDISLVTMHTTNVAYFITLKFCKKNGKLRNGVVLSKCNVWKRPLKKNILFSMVFYNKKNPHNNINNYIQCNFATTLQGGQYEVNVMPNSAPIRYKTWPRWNNSMYHIRLLGSMIMGSSDDESRWWRHNMLQFQFVWLTK